jgi:hypothetical protein
MHPLEQPAQHLGVDGLVGKGLAMPALRAQRGQELAEAARPGIALAPRQQAAGAAEIQMPACGSA